MADSQVIVKVDNFNLAEAKVRGGLADGIAALAFALQEEAQNNVQEVGAIDTGAMRSSIYTDTYKSNGRESAISQAKAKGANPGAKTGAPHEVPIASEGTQISGEHQAKVGVAVEYGLYVEMGTVRMDARPYMAPAVETIKGKADRTVGQFIRQAVG